MAATGIGGPAAPVASQEGLPKAAFFDLDGTLSAFDASAPIDPVAMRCCAPPTEEVAQAVRKMVAAGNLAFVCTGRARCNLHPGVLELPWSGMVTLYGGHVTLGDEVLRDVPFTQAQLEALVGAVAAADGDALFVGDERCFQMGGGVPLLGSWPEARDVGDAMRLLDGATIGKVFLDFATGELIQAAPVAESLLYMPGLGHSEPWSEYCPAGNDKMVGIEAVLSALDGHVGTTYGFGDSDLDLPMIRRCDVGVAMGNASDGLKAEASFVAGDVRSSGVAGALADLGLLG